MSFRSILKWLAWFQLLTEILSMIFPFNCTFFEMLFPFTEVVKKKGGKKKTKFSVDHNSLSQGYFTTMIAGLAFLEDFHQTMGKFLVCRVSSVASPYPVLLVKWPLQWKTPSLKRPLKGWRQVYQIVWFVPLMRDHCVCCTFSKLQTVRLGDLKVTWQGQI